MSKQFYSTNKNSYMQKLTLEKYNNLVHAIYMGLMNTKTYDSEGELVEMGMSEMGDCEDAARDIVVTWMIENNIELIETVIA